MRLGILGPLLVADESGRALHLAGRARIVLAGLALRANRVVSADELAELVFDGGPSAQSTLRSNVRRLRVALGPAWAERIVTQPPGYLCRVDEPELDVLAFEALCRQAGEALRAGRWVEASGLAGRAVGLWRGAPLVDVASQSLHDEFVPRFEQLRTQLLEDKAEADLRLGGHERLVQPLRELIAQHPLNERFRAQLMVALVGSGRRAEALSAYHDARKVLVGELGVEPGPEMRSLHERILTGDTDLLLERAPEQTEVLVSSVPRQLPAAPGHFVGRQADLDLIVDLGRRSGTAAGAGLGGMPTVICAIDGMAGIGKTALAVHAAHRLAGDFPDGQLFVDLHGHTKGHPPREPGDALGVLLRALQVPAQRIPDETEERAALYRQCLSGTHTLILLDNVHDEAQARPLLPGAPGCMVLMTSRRRLKGLDDAHSLSLDLLSGTESATLLRVIAGTGHVLEDDLQHDPLRDPLLAKLVELCGRLPLALRIAGALLRHRPAWNLRHLVTRLDDEGRRVSALADSERELGMVFDLSITGLDTRHQLLVRRLGLIPGLTLDAHAAAALLDSELDVAEALLEDLVDHNLLVAYAPGRYRQHDLIRAHTRALAERDPCPEREDAVDRLLRYYAVAAQHASAFIARYPLPAMHGAAPAPAPVPALADPDAARDWLRIERESLEAAYSHARTHALDRHAVALAEGLADILRTDGPWSQALALYTDTVAAAARLGDRSAQARALLHGGDIRGLTGDYPGAAGDTQRALALYRVLGDRFGQAAAMAQLGQTEARTGGYRDSIRKQSDVLRLYRALGSRRGQALVLNQLAETRGRAADFSGAAGDYREALELYGSLGDSQGRALALLGLGEMRRLGGDHVGAASSQREALRIFRAIRHRRGHAAALTNLGEIHLAGGDHLSAARDLNEALKLYQGLGDQQGQGNALTLLGSARRLAGDQDGARIALEEALLLFRNIGARGNEVFALNQYAAVIATTGERDNALVHYRDALNLARLLSQADEEAHALEGIGGCHFAGGENGLAAACLTQALEIFQRVGMPSDAARVRARLTDLPAA